jgi:hypothetical protein
MGDSMIHWTRNVPLEAGFYWYRRGPEAEEEVTLLEYTVLGSAISFIGSAEEEFPIEGVADGEFWHPKIERPESGSKPIY